MFNILTLNKISKCGLDNLNEKNYKCSDNSEKPDAIMVRSASLHEFNFDENTVAVARAGAGVNNIPVDDCADKGIVVFNTPGANANAVKELVICGLLISSRKVIDAIEWCKTLKGEGDAVAKLVEKGKSNFAGPEILGKTLGVIGLGAIGNMVANAAIAMGMNVIGYDPYLSVSGALSLNPEVKLTADIDDIYKSSDYISVHVPLNDSTKGFVNKESIGKMKDNVRILNFARGGLVDENDIINALESEKVAAYVTDFPTDKIIGVKGVIAIPHLGASSPESEENCASMAAIELANYLEKGIIRNSVNFPDVNLPGAFDTRVCVIYKDGKDVQAKIAAEVGQSVSFISATRKGKGYLVADIEGDVGKTKLESIDGVVRVRILK
ncbi:MAG TPA: 3-phosphoglycerate dehydrogenase family protein [Clostridia bacterium]|nr:3-phosphoglycerate dehydrogenase family protein [Clostridia bacterium]